jgi:hypothetical protein
MTPPKSLRKTLGVDKGGVVMASTEADGVVLHPAVAFPIEMYADARIAEFDEAELDRLRQVVALTHAFHLPADVQLAEKDKPVLAGAIGSGCTHLWTSDRLHFGAWFGKELHGVTVVSSIRLADLLQEDRR